LKKIPKVIHLPDIMQTQVNYLRTPKPDLAVKIGSANNGATTTAKLTNSVSQLVTASADA